MLGGRTRCSGAPSLRGVEAAPSVGIVDGDELLRRRVTDALGHEGFAIVVDAASVDELLGRSDHLDVVVVVVWGDSGRLGMESLVRIREHERDLPVVVVVPGSAVSSSTLHDALSAGASGVVAEDDLANRLGPTVRAVSVGQLVIPFERRQAVGRPLLSPREKRVLSMVVLGFTNLEIANKLYVAETTVKSHLSSAYGKLGVRSRQEATARILDPSQGLGLGILSLAEDRSAPEPVAIEGSP